LSVGVRGAHVTVGKRGVTRTVGIPGSGIFYTSRSDYHTGVHSANREYGELPPDTRPNRFPRWLLAAVVVGFVVGIVAAVVIAAMLQAR
jgi:hypothetical protein